MHNEQDLARFLFDSPTDPCRYQPLLDYVARHRGRFAFFGGLNGPFGFLWRLVGREAAFYEIVDRPHFVRQVVTTVTEFALEVGKGLLRVCPDLLGIVISDDIAYNQGMMLSPRTYRELFLPALQRMCLELKAAGARFVVYHSDGDIREAIPMLIEAGVDALHPLEVRAVMDVFELKARYGHQLAFIGNVDNSELLPRGTRQEIRREVLRKLTAARGGGYIIGSSHSIGPDVPVANYEYFRELVTRYGTRGPLYDIIERCEADG